jgi:hypothetical protein
MIRYHHARVWEWIYNKLLASFPQLTLEDLKSENNIRVSFIPYFFHVKLHAQFSVYRHYEQAERNCHKATRHLEPILVIKGNHKKPLAIVDAEHFFAMLRAAYDARIVNLNDPDRDANTGT